MKSRKRENIALKKLKIKNANIIFKKREREEAELEKPCYHLYQLYRPFQINKMVSRVMFACLEK